MRQSNHHLLHLLLLWFFFCSWIAPSTAFAPSGRRYSSSRSLLPARSTRSFFSSSSNPLKENKEHPGEAEQNLSNDDKDRSNNRTNAFARLRRQLALYYAPPAENDGRSFRQKLAALGLAALLSYGFVSNMSYCVSVSCAWYIFSRQTGLSPLAPGQWKPFLAVYAGFFLLNNVLRPLRLAIALGVVAPQFERLLQWLQRRLRISRTVAIGLTVFLANIVGTLSFMTLGILGAALLAQVPIR